MAPVIALIYLVTTLTFSMKKNVSIMSDGVYSIKTASNLTLLMFVFSRTAD